ncbi:MAG: hypothetical protein QG670_521 [Thermoproteota archaeon]|nr:hypothetical protein [Thermoproteota archaeon]
MFKETLKALGRKDEIWSIWEKSNEKSLVTGNYRILIISWIIMDLVMEMPSPNFQYYVQALGGTGIELGLLD